MPEPNESSRASFLKNLRDWVDVIFKVVLALVGVVVGYFFSLQKQQNDDIKLIVDMVSAEQHEKRIMGASIAQEYLLQRRIPLGVYTAVLRYANNSPDAQLRAAVNSAAAETAKNVPAVQQALARVTQSLPVRIYFHIRKDEDRGAAAMLERELETSAAPDSTPIVVPGIEHVAGAQSKSILKCFKKAECEALGPFLVKLIQDAGTVIELSDQSATYEKSTAMRPRHFEAWFAAGFGSASTAGAGAK